MHSPLFLKRTTTNKSGISRSLSLIEEDLGQQLLMQLVDGVTVVHDLEPAHHIARNTGLLLVADLLAHWIVLPDGLALLVVVVTLRL